MRDAPVEPPTPESAEAAALTDAVVAGARGAGVKVSELTAEDGHPLARLAGLVATTDFAATYLAIGLGIDPAVSAHVAELAERTGR
jgi:hypothetical protein